MADTFNDKYKSRPENIAAVNPRRLVKTINQDLSNQERIKQLEDALTNLLAMSLINLDTILWEWDSIGGIEDCRAAGELPKEIITAELLLNKKDQ